MGDGRGEGFFLEALFAAKRYVMVCLIRRGVGGGGGNSASCFYYFFLLFFDKVPTARNKDSSRHRVPLTPRSSRPSSRCRGMTVTSSISQRKATSEGESPGGRGNAMMTVCSLLKSKEKM